MRINDNNFHRAWREPDEIDIVALRQARTAPAPLAEPEAETPFWDTTPATLTTLQQLPAASLQTLASAPPPAAAYVGEPPVDGDWLAQREGAFQAVRADFEATRAAAQAQVGGAGWVDAVMVTDESGNTHSASGRPTVFVPDSNAPPQIIGWDEGGPVYAPVTGRWLEFDDEAFAAHYRAQGGAPLQNLARLYDTDAATLLARHPEVWHIATHDHAINAGPPPAGRAMGDPGQLGMLELYLSDPQVAELIATYGGGAAPASGGLAPEQARIYGARRYEQLTKLGTAMQAVRDAYSGALAHAHAHGGPGWTERPRMVTFTDESGQRITQPVMVYDESGQGTPVIDRVFDPDIFTDWYLAQGGVANRAFASFYGRSHSEFGTDESGATVVTRITFDNPKWQMWGVGGGMQHQELVRIDPNHPPELNDNSAIGFDLEAGWATHHSNIHEDRDWFETLVQVAIVAVVGYFTAGAVSGWAASAGWGSTAAAAAAGAAAGAATSVVSGAMNGSLAFKDIMRGALAGGLSGGLLAEFGGVVAANYGPVGTVALRTTVQGGIQALLGGSFSDGAIAGFASGLADVASANVNANIERAVAAGTMDAAQATAARTFARVLGSAIRAAGNPGDPAAAFASAFLSDVIAETDPAGFRRPAAIQLAFDDEGYVMPGIVDANAPWAQQQAQLRARLVQQGLDPASADAAVAEWTARVEHEAFDAFVTAQPAPLLVAGVGWTPDVRDARQVIDQIESRIADGTLRGADIGNAIHESYDAYLRLAAGVSASGAAPTHDQELAAARLITLIGDLGHLASDQGVSLTQAQQDLVRQSRAVQVQRYLPEVYGAATGGGILALRQNYRLAALDAWAARPHLRHPDTLIGRSDGGPGEWVYVPRRTAGADLQEQVSGVPRGIEYRVNGVDFDGFDAARGVAVDSKDWRGYPPPGTDFWQSNTVGEAMRQLNALRGTGVRLEWQVSSDAAASQLRQAFGSRDLAPDVRAQLANVSIVVVTPRTGP